MSKFKFESTITLGTLVTLFSLFLSLGTIWIRIETVLAKHEVRIENLERVTGIRSAQHQYEPSRKPGS